MFITKASQMKTTFVRKPGIVDIFGIVLNLYEQGLSHTSFSSA
jgi:hypothetical protein